MKVFLEHLKKNFLRLDSQDSGRLFHGRGKVLLGHEFLNIDYFNPVIILFVYSEPPKFFIEQTIAFLTELIGEHLKGIIVQKRYLPQSPSEVVFGAVDDEMVCVIENLRYSLKFNQTQNIGYFLDMQEGRKYLIKNSLNKNILNLFSYTCALSVVALNSGASKVVNFDMSKAAIKRGIVNHQINNIDLKKVKFFDHDIFKSFARINREGPFDLIIIDPPSDHGENFNISRDYAKLIKRSLGWLNEEGVILTCLNSPAHSFEFLRQLVVENAPNLKLIHQMGLPEYFRETNPDSGLKILVWSK